MPIQSPNVIGFSSDFYGGDGVLQRRRRRLRWLAPMTIVPGATSDVERLELDSERMMMMVQVKKNHANANVSTGLN